MASTYSKIARVIKLVFGIKDFSLFKKDVKKRFGKLWYRRKYSAEDVVRVMTDLGMKEGSLVCVHSSMKEFYNYKGTAVELISLILKTIGPSGTLVMPAFPDYGYLKEDYVFNPKTDKTGAGYLAEVFRNSFDVIRSVNVQSSVTAIGPLASFLCDEHVKSKDPWDRFSPWFKLCEQDALVFNLGMPHNYISTFEHCVESLLQNDHPYWSQFFTKSIVQKYLKEDGSVSSYENITCEIERRPYEPTIYAWLSEKDWKYSQISNLKIKVFYSKHCLDKMLNLGRIGVSLYKKPSTKKWNF